ncbi:MAG: hypothetical protein HC811_14195 [Flammeovirgaceae bacterium]|nr:hypothetical protein [Flammeovirgaceae bacterium]
MDPGFFVNYYHNANDGTIQQVDFYLFPVYIFFQDGSFIQYAITPTLQNINFDFSILGLPIAQDQYTYTRQLIQYNTDQSKKYGLSGSYEFGSYYNGTLNSTTASLRFAPIPNIALTASYEHNHFKQVGSEQADLKTHLATGELRLAYNANLLASAFYQYNSYDEKGRWNIRASWQFAPLSFLYIVFNESSFDNSPIQNQSLITKLTYLKQF